LATVSSLRFASRASASLLVVLSLFGCAKSGGGGGGGASSAASTATPRRATTTRPGSTTSAVPSRSTSTIAPVPTTAAPVSKPVLVVCGLKAEEAIAQGPNVVVVLSAGDTALLRSRLAKLVPTDYQAVVSFGVSGGLLPGFKDGDLMLARTVVLAQGSGQWTADANLNATIVAKLAAAGITVATGVFAGSDVLGATNSPAGKAALRAATGADNVDMESHIAAQFAASGNVPFVAIRSPSDDYTQSLPAAALVPLLPDGSTDYVGVALSVIQDPTQIPALIQLDLDTNAALAALKGLRQVVDLGGL
jgi:adenosylhomocysteine nucleosidase